MNVDTRLDSDDNVRNPQFGIGRVVSDLGQTAIVRFGQQLQECRKADLDLLPSPRKALAAGKLHSPLEAVLRIQAEAIRSINEAWGVFARTRIQLLPHQLWVCRKVTDKWPCRWLVADDVGLGKTIEAGLILSALMSRGKTQRVLILCPASLVGQWQYRLRTMFDIRTLAYTPEADTPNSDFWNTNRQVVASLQTLRLDNKKRRQRLIESDPWDLVIVDEAHHLGADEHSGATLGYGLLEELVTKNRAHSMAFFTGTPHRGKSYGFFALLKLLRPDLFDPNRPAADQYKLLKEVMIRNNKQNVTDLQGRRLFKKHTVESHTYEYLEAEEKFYDMLTRFIVTGKTHASRLGHQDARMVMLVLITMQKLASSSVAAIRRALKGRLARQKERLETMRDLRLQKDRLLAAEQAEQTGDLDKARELEEQLAELSAELTLMDGEREFLESLVKAADEITEETKIKAILDKVRTLDSRKSVLFFTEYKATQSLLMSALIAEFGENSVAFINGDGRADDVRSADGRSRSITMNREEAANLFNEGKARFLVSTEAGGEGIDLHQSCHTLIHVDLPWNPMRMHQRVGRLNRYGQKEQVNVTTFRNPKTVESRIWDKLNQKIEQINLALRNVMDDPEDLLQLVLGMTSSTVFTDLFSEAANVRKDSFDSWFDSKTTSFGGKDAIETVRQLVGNATRFDFGSILPQLPQVDLPDLKPFFLGTLHINQRRPTSDDSGLSFKTPDAWRADPVILASYQNMVFDRQTTPGTSTENLLGIGHRLVDVALDQATNLPACVGEVSRQYLQAELFVFRVFDRVTTKEATLRSVVLAVEKRAGEPQRILRDWELLKKLNALPHMRLGKDGGKLAANDVASLQDALSAAEEACRSMLPEVGQGFSFPDFELLGVLHAADLD